MKFLKKSPQVVAAAAVAPEPESEPQPEPQPEPVKAATVSEDSIDVIIQINVKKSNDELTELAKAKEGITIKVNDKAISLETSASVEEAQKFVDDLQQAVSHDATTKQEDEEEQQEQATTIPSVLDKLMFWKATIDRPAKEEEKKKEETVMEESQKQEETVEKKEEVEPVAEAAETEAPKESVEKEEAIPAAEAEAETSQEESVEKKEEAEPAAEAEVPKEQEESNPFCFLQNKLTFWQDEATKEQKEEAPVAEESKPEAETEKKEVEDEAFSHKIEVFVDGAAIQTIRLTNAGMDHLKNFMTSVQEEARLKGESVAVTQAWLAEKMSEFFESAKVQGDAVVSSDEAAPTTPSSDAANIKEETAEVATQPAAKRSWWPFSNATENTEEKAVDDARNETAEEVKEDATEQMREVAEAA
eukprot:CAMPEP_0201718882 /NCGR_PEP_ID=MMETSP0593-20130828/4295_1 /ASSEMBLY_ACC=CAM_ASM_000672 /TAXON_ID=267983 /ORGANISM="Skeletonema japonicum, Strain CCMP2506" /LENGTH=416 /DNA_ID=CAMNT_0048209269 /DNA_START=32 /DNA_END=1282 /DNA_ORIENTATION=-